MIMKRLIKKKPIAGVILLLMIGFGEVKAQQEPMFTQYMFNTLWVNPAYAGTTRALNINSLTRLQWVGLDGAPKTYSVSLHTPITDKKAGLGLTMVNDVFGPVKNTYLTGNYAYRVMLSENLTLSMGIKGGINSYFAGLKDLSIVDRDDPQFESNERKISPNLGAGLYLYSDKFYMGVSAPKLLETSIDEEYSNGNFETRRHYYFIGGFIWKLAPNWIFKPSVFTQSVSNAPLTHNISFQFLYDQRIWLGAMFRPGDAAGAFFNLKINKRLTIGYGYDFTFSSLSTTNSGSHEIMFSFDFVDFAPGKVKSPRYF